MNGCAVRRGFFTLRGCSEPASNLCMQCQKMACEEHIDLSSGTSLCVECASRQETGKEQAQKGKQDKYAKEDVWYDRGTPYYYRNRYYSTRSYYPYSHHHYHDQDYRSFDRENAVPGEMSEESADGFLDS